jgi:predicted nucleic acid-binding protein
VNRDKSQDLSAGDTDANSLGILPQARRVATSRLRHAESHTLGPVCENVQRLEGPLVTDAYVAALAIEHGCELITTDSDFSRFQGLRWRHPLGA